MFGALTCIVEGCSKESVHIKSDASHYLSSTSAYCSDCYSRLIKGEPLRLDRNRLRTRTRNFDEPLTKGSLTT